MFAEQDLGVINREKLCRICGCEKDRWGSEQVFYLAVLHINKESFEHERFRPVDHELVRFTSVTFLMRLIRPVRNRW